MVKNDLREQLLFKDQPRVSVVPPPPEATGSRLSGRKILVNLAVLALAFIFFGAGYWIAHPTLVEAALSNFGAYWNDWLQNVYGSDLGSGLAEKTPWILARAGGILSYLALWCGMMLGLFTSLRWVKGASIMYLHRLLVLLGLVFLVTHLAGLVFDYYMPISLAQSLVPFASPYRPLWTALGTFTLYGIGLVGISAYLASKLGYKVWRTLHYLGFGLFWFSFLHGFFAGTDSSFSWMQLIYLVSGLSILSLTLMRLVKSRLKKRRATN